MLSWAEGNELRGQGDGMIAAGAGTCATAQRKSGIYVISLDGKVLDFLPVPRDEVTNCAFGSDGLKTLYIAAGGRLYSIRTTTPGRVIYCKVPSIANKPLPPRHK